MKLRNKVLLAISITWLGFLALTYAGTRVYLLNNFLDLEQHHITRDLNRTDAAMQQFDHSLYVFAVDWSHWDGLYNYMLGKNPNFISENMLLNAFINADVNLLTYWDTNGKMIFGTAVDLEKKQLTSYPKDMNKYFYPGSLLLNRKDINLDVSGYILLDNRIMMIAATAITNGSATQPSLGAMVAGRFLTPSVLSTMELATRLQLQIFTINDVLQNPSLSEALRNASANNGYYQKAVSKETMEAFSLISDIFGKPIGIIKLIEPRTIYLRGLATINYYLISFILLGILFSLLILWLLKSLVLDRLEKLDNEIADISANHAIEHRVTVAGNDELSSVASEINALLSTIQKSHEQLQESVANRTHELHQTTAKLQTEKTERQQVEKELTINKENLIQLAHYDSLTTLPNRVFFNEIFTKALRNAQRHQKTLSLLLVDIDRFKNVNDVVGHASADLVLKELAHRFAGILRAGDVLARLGGDEFIILLNDIPAPKFASHVAEKLLQVCTKPIKSSSREFFLTSSIGISVFPNDGKTLEDLQKNADLAMHKAKRSGGGNFQYYTLQMNEEAHQHIELESALRRAINNNEFVLYFQPKLNLHTGEIAGVEALIRWESPNGAVEPSGFIPLAEETGLIMQIGEWALREACKINKSWQEQGFKPISVAVNLSPKQFQHQDISLLIKKVLEETGLKPEYLEVEITETAVMSTLDEATSRLKEIADMGVTISIDDFGTGYTSISYLKHFPVHVLKIDQSFIKGIPHNQNDVAITSAVIAMAHNLGIKIVAEGVETPEQVEYLRKHGCDMIQGYYLSRPLPEKKIVLQFTKADTPSSHAL